MKKRLLWYLLVLSSSLIGLYAVINYFSNIINVKVHPEMIKAFISHPIGINVHIVSSSLALVIGPILLSKSIREKSIKLHSLLGVIYLFLGVLPGAISGFYVSFFAFGGLISTFGFGLLAILWFVTGLLALKSIIMKDVSSHGIWVIRNYSLTFAAVTLRIYMGIFFLIGFKFEFFYPVAAWLCWVGNLIIAEWIILRSVKTVKQITN